MLKWVMTIMAMASPPPSKKKEKKIWSFFLGGEGGVISKEQTLFVILHPVKTQDNGVQIGLAVPKKGFAGFSPPPARPLTGQSHWPSLVFLQTKTLTAVTKVLLDANLAEQDLYCFSDSQTNRDMEWNK